MRGTRVPHLFVAACLLAVGLLAIPVANAGAPKLEKAKAKVLALRTANQVRDDMLEDGAERAKVNGCWRNSRQRVSCYITVKGYDEELEFHWTCMLRVVVDLRPHASGARRYHRSYGHAVCG